MLIWTATHLGGCGGGSCGSVGSGDFLNDLKAVNQFGVYLMNIMWRLYAFKFSEISKHLEAS